MLKNRIARKKFLLDKYNNLTCECCTLKVRFCAGCGEGFKEGDAILCIEDATQNHFIKHFCFGCIDIARAVKEQRGVPCKPSPLEVDIGSSDYIAKKNRDSKQDIDIENVKEK